MIKKFLQVTFFGLLFWYLFSEIDIEKLFIAIQGYSLIGLMASVFLIFISYLLLALRWYYMTNKRCKMLPSYEATVIAGFLNTLLPAKAGEVSKVFYLKKYYNYTVNNSLSLLFIERFFDIIILSLFLAIINVYFAENKQIEIALFILTSVILLFLITLKTKMLINIMKYIPIRIVNIFGKKIIKTINNQLRGKILIKTTLATIALWISYFLLYLVFFGFTVNFDLNLYQIFIFFIVSTVALSIPFTPNGAGTLQAAIVFAGNVFDIIKEDALAASIIIYLIMILVDFVLFMQVIVKKDIDFNELFKK